jgi:hypothetical protein
VGTLCTFTVLLGSVDLGWENSCLEIAVPMGWAVGSSIYLGVFILILLPCRRPVVPTISSA